uniref:ATP synthase subunit b n=1 Tax=Streptomyces achromogenes subsp. streptozoticus TaxID=285532 RepID=A0A411MRL2_STRC2|nr:ATP synthase subunit b [Streptomyces achromogenes subsp. streptozoticus]
MRTVREAGAGWSVGRRQRLLAECTVGGTADPAGWPPLSHALNRRPDVRRASPVEPRRCQAPLAVAREAPAIQVRRCRLQAADGAERTAARGGEIGSAPRVSFRGGAFGGQSSHAASHMRTAEIVGLPGLPLHG